MAAKQKYAKRQKRLTPEQKEKKAEVERKVKKIGMIFFIVLIIAFAVNAYYAYMHFNPE